jgi:glycosyltransferase involved in cell wall biosynthesis
VAIQANYQWPEFSRKRFGKLSMKVTHIIDSGGYYGAEVMLVHLCQAQQKAGLQVEVISIGTRGNYKKPLEEKLEEYGIPCLSWRMLALPDLRESFKILRHCRTSGTDVIHSHGYKGNILLGLIPKRWRKIPVITTVHGYTRHDGISKMAVNQLLDRICLPRLDSVVLVSNGMKQQVPEKKIGRCLCIIENGIPGNANNTAQERIEFFSENTINLLSIGRLSKEKNFSFLIEKVARLRELNTPVRLVIFGEGPERENLEKLIERIGVKTSVHLPGYISNPEAAYPEADMYINCSITEGMPITLLESLRAGCLPLASNIDANKAILKGEKFEGLIFSLQGSDFEKKVMEYYKIRKSFKESLQNLFLDKYTIEAMQLKYELLYKKLLEMKNEK